MIKRTKTFHVLMSLAMLIWGGSWVSAKLIAGMLPSQVLVFYRFLFTFLCYGAVLIIIREKPRLSRRSFVQIILATLFYVMYSQLFFAGLRTGFAGIGGVLVTTLNPIFTFIIASSLFKRSVTWREIGGLMIGICGGGVILRIWDLDTRLLLESGNLFFLLAAFVWASLTVSSQHAQKDLSVWTYSFYINGFATVFQIPFAAPEGITGVFHLGPFFWAQMTYLSLISTTFATTIYFYATDKLGPRRASSFTFLVPLCAIVMSWLILDEKPGISIIAGGIIAIIAVYIINYKTARLPLQPLSPKD